MKINVEVDDRILEEAMNMTSIEKENDVVNLALSELVNKIKKQKLLSFGNSDYWHGDLNDMRKSAYEKIII